MRHGLVLFLAAAIPRHRLTAALRRAGRGLDESSRLGEREGASSPSEAGAAALDPLASERLAVWPLLVLDAGAFLTLCRSCSWASTRQPGLEAVLAAFEAHACKEPSP